MNRTDRVTRRPHMHSFDGGFLAEKVPTVDGGHTSFFVFTCVCGLTQIFPRVNYELTTAAFQAALLARLAFHDCYLEPLDVM
jgi:hypothetical protein